MPLLVVTVLSSDAAADVLSGVASTAALALQGLTGRTATASPEGEVDKEPAPEPPGEPPAAATEMPSRTIVPAVAQPAASPPANAGLLDPVALLPAARAAAPPPPCNTPTPSGPRVTEILVHNISHSDAVFSLAAMLPAAEGGYWPPLPAAAAARTSASSASSASDAPRPFGDAATADEEEDEEEKEKLVLARPKFFSFAPVTRAVLLEVHLFPIFNMYIYLEPPVTRAVLLKVYLFPRFNMYIYLEPPVTLKVEQRAAGGSAPTAAAAAAAAGGLPPSRSPLGAGLEDALFPVLSRDSRGEPARALRVALAERRL